MPRRCTVCQHPAREAIDEALVAGIAVSALFREYRDISEDALSRHKANHLPARLVMAEKAKEVAVADGLLQKVEELRLEAMAVLEEARAAEDGRLRLAAIDRAGKQLELLAKLLGELDERPVVNLNVSTEWLELRAVIVGALEPHEEAQEAVLKAIESAGNGYPSR